jgi:hypothetical protein
MPPFSLSKALDFFPSCFSAKARQGGTRQDRTADSGRGRHREGKQREAHRAERMCEYVRRTVRVRSRPVPSSAGHSARRQSAAVGLPAPDRQAGGAARESRLKQRREWHCRIASICPSAPLPSTSLTSMPRVSVLHCSSLSHATRPPAAAVRTFEAHPFKQQPQRFVVTPSSFPSLRDTLQSWLIPRPRSRRRSNPSGAS